MNAFEALGLMGVLVGVAAVCVIALVFAITSFGDSETIDGLALDRRIADANSCDASPAGTGPQTDLDRRRAMVAAWILGVREGAFAGWTKQLREGAAISQASGMNEWLAQSRQHAAEANAAADRMAAVLKTQRPAPFPAAGGDTGLSAFRDFVEAGRQPTARGLAAAYSPRVCEVYKTGAYWGFSILFRAAAPTKRNVYASEITFYAKRLGLPDQHLRAMLDPSTAGMDSAQIQAASEQLSRRIAEYWNAQ